MAVAVAVTDGHRPPSTIWIGRHWRPWRSRIVNEASLHPVTARSVEGSQKRHTRGESVILYSRSVAGDSAIPAATCQGYCRGCRCTAEWRV